MAIPAVLIALASCTTSHTTTTGAPLRAEAKAEAEAVSWAAFCQAEDVDPESFTHEDISRYLDTWVGSTEEEAALTSAGII